MPDCRIVWLTADVHYTAAHYFDPAKAKHTDFLPFWEFISGPLHAGGFGPNKADGTFGSTFPNGCHIVEVEVDADTGVTEVVSYCAVDDCGEVIHHAIVEGQLHGGILQGNWPSTMA